MAAKAVGKAMAKAKPVKEGKPSPSTAAAAGSGKEKPVRISVKRGAAGKKSAESRSSLEVAVPMEAAVAAVPAAKKEDAVASASTGGKPSKKAAKADKVEDKKTNAETVARTGTPVAAKTAKTAVKAEKVDGRKAAAKVANRSRTATTAERVKDAESPDTREGGTREADTSTGGAELAAAGAPSVDILRAVPRAEGEEEEQDDGFLPLDATVEAEIQEAAEGKKSKKRKGAQGSGSPAGPVGLPGDEDKPNVLYLARIPHGFYEDQMAGFFGQFGKITRLRLSRNKKTGKSKHFAFIEFESPEVAAIVAECMNNYLLFGSVLQSKLVPREKLHPMTWVGANRKFRQVPWKKMAKERQNKVRSPEEEAKRLKRWMRSDQKRRVKLAAAGIEYDFEGLDNIVVTKPKHTKFGDDEEEERAPEVPKKKKVKA